uniref:Sushi domain-containing protein n=1 Tax=Meleagris gallopavo TaxID=9103 RepID=A0A803XKE5_MELGA
MHPRYTLSFFLVFLPCIHMGLFVKSSSKGGWEHRGKAQPHPWLWGRAGGSVCCSPGRCPSPPAVDYADRRQPYELLVGSTITYFCRHGFVLIPGVSPTTTCLKNFTWSAIPALCQGEFCAPPPLIINGQHTGLRTELFPYGTEVKYSCAAGLSLIGDESIYCTSEDGVNLTWSGPAPECRVVRCPRPVVAQGRMDLSWHTFPYGTSVRFSCSEGFVLHGSAESRCMADGSWQPALPKCQPVANGKLTSTDQTWYPINTTVTFVCHEGYHHFSGDGEAALKDSWTATCLADGNWTPLPKCVSIVVWLFLDERCLISAMKSNPDPLKKPLLHCRGGGCSCVQPMHSKLGKSLKAAVWVPICSNSITRGFLCFCCFA